MLQLTSDQRHASVMETDLRLDLFEALEGLDPLEFLAQDPDLSSLVQNIESDPSYLDGQASHGGETPEHWDGIEGRPSQYEQKNIVDKGNKNMGPTNSCVCSVCGKPAKGHKYYGVVTCLSCKAFFSRSMKGEAYKTYLCKNPILESGCFVNSKSWISCQSCRFGQCLAAGMVMPSKEKKSIEKVEPGCNAKNIQSKAEIKADPRRDMINLKRLLQPSTLITLEEKLKLEKLLLASANIRWKVVVDLCRKNMELLPPILQFVFYGDIYPMPIKQKVDDYCVVCRTEEYINSEGPLGDDIRPMDRLRLVAENIPLVHEYLVASKIGKTLVYDLDVEAYFSATPKEEDKNLHNQARSMYSQVTNSITKCLSHYCLFQITVHVIFIDVQE